MTFLFAIYVFIVYNYRIIKTIRQSNERQNPLKNRFRKEENEIFQNDSSIQQQIYLVFAASCRVPVGAYGVCFFSVRHDLLFLQFQGVLRRGFQDDLPCRVRDKSEVILSWHSGAYRYPRVFQHTFRRG